MSKIREYKWTKQGTWKNYPNDGILLIKAGYKDKVLSGSNFIMKIEDENGNLVDFKGDYYVVTESFNQIMENVFMRWDTVKPDKPVITPDTTDITKNVEVVITYPKDVVNKEYRIVYEDGTVIGWMSYTNYITMEKNGTIYARGENEARMVSDEESLKIENVDEQEPTILLNGNFQTITNNIKVKVEVTDDQGIDIIKWAKGKQKKSYFDESGTTVINNGEVEIKDNGEYTFYARDKAGRETLYYQEVKNIDNVPPVVDIQVLTKTFGIQAEVEMSFGDSVIKEYKIGTSNKTYSMYTGKVRLTSTYVLDNNLQNKDGTVSIYAKGIDRVGNETIIEKKITVLDLERPETPAIKVNGLGGYPVLTEYGVKTELTSTISFTESNNTTNLYSIDNGVTWIEYKKEFEIPTTVTKVMAKSIKKDTGLESKVETKTISNTLPPYAIGTSAYDGNKSTFIEGNMGQKGIGWYWNLYMDVDESMVGREVELTWMGGKTGDWWPTKLSFMDSSSNIIGTYDSGEPVGVIKTNIYKIPQNTTRIKFEISYAGYMDVTGKIYEIRPAMEPQIITKKEYPTIDEYGVTPGYNSVTINYFPTTTQKLYRIGTTGEWKVYENKMIRLGVGEILYARGIDKNGNETNIVSATANLPSYSVEPSAYDGNKSTFIEGNMGQKGTSYYWNLYMDVDESMREKEIELTWMGGKTGDWWPTKLSFMDSNGNIIGTYDSGTPVGVVKTNIYKIPQNATRIKFELAYGDVRITGKIYEITVVNSTPKGRSAITSQMKRVVSAPRISINNTNWSTEKLVSINYGENDYKKEYSLDLGKTWLEYTGSISAKEKTTVLTRIMNNGKVISSSGYKVTRIDNTSPTISLDLLPNSITVGDNYSLPSSYTVDNTKSGGKSICTINDVEYTTTKDLLPGKYSVVCTVTTGAGLTNTTSKEIEVTDKSEIKKKEEPTPSSSPDSEEKIKAIEIVPDDEPNIVTGSSNIII